MDRLATEGAECSQEPRFLNMTKHGHGNATVGGRGEARTEHSQPVGPRAGKQRPREPRPSPLNKHHMATEHKSTFLNLPRRGAKGKKKKKARRAARERENNKNRAAEGAPAGEGAGGRRWRRLPCCRLILGAAARPAPSPVAGVSPARQCARAPAASGSGPPGAGGEVGTGERGTGTGSRRKREKERERQVIFCAQGRRAGEGKRGGLGRRGGVGLLPAPHCVPAGCV